MALSGCGDAGSSGTAAPSGSASGGASRPARPSPATELVVLDDDKKLQTVDNLIPAVNADEGLAASSSRRSTRCPRR